ncbi:MAG: DUF4244 domain-containing protein [Arthrobacter sp.]|uniref:DUF4244 domain-containing protein n=1 Tax=unclassified Arthrobacter TaxID=235627 RepID=UPI0026500E74|nr:DUF4244 domain-containing protein [Micrococcaceae bacterium]MDN5812062.1 DUF4244 domain-containing protein [Micrococcaceae bacterium]MDN5825213.1 DUF4244 domain-containing protein [Micrococcaceae bacterium]MDN5885412.1 DUF4244 domain-containing protein [Micrococcaceae bacterium]MDN5906516.1 DUF4244 domain-containing protein [Micrococcaceae bacterium]
MNEQDEQVDPGGHTRAGGPEDAAEIGSGSGSGEEGIATAEFAIVALAAVGFAGLLVSILSSGGVRELLMGLVRQALSF